MALDNEISVESFSLRFRRLVDLTFSHSWDWNRAWSRSAFDPLGKTLEEVERSGERSAGEKACSSISQPKNGRDTSVARVQCTSRWCCPEIRRRAVEYKMALCCCSMCRETRSVDVRRLHDRNERDVVKAWLLAKCFVAHHREGWFCCCTAQRVQEISPAHAEDSQPLDVLCSGIGCRTYFVRGLRSGQLSVVPMVDH